MIRIDNLKVLVKEHVNLKEEVSKKLHIDINKIKDIEINRFSIDARKKEKFFYVYSLNVSLDNEDKYIKLGYSKVVKNEYMLPLKTNNIKVKSPIIIGSGPAGLFCGYMLAKYGYKPIIIERGKKIEDRLKDVTNLWDNNIFLEESNVLFGEGGAGTFSDGKLNTLVKDKFYRMREVFKIFVECGAPKEIMYNYMPHIGTDILREVVVNLRKKIINMGGSILYSSKLEDIEVCNNELKSILVNGKNIPCDILVLAIGHSARDTFKMLNKRNVLLESKPFAVGFRVIHKQSIINENQYPINYPFLPAASYKLTYKSSTNHGVYSFCMCPGGYVVNARSTSDGMCINGMSNYKRDSGYANSAIVVTVDSTYYGDDLFAGMYFQEDIEKKAFSLGNGNIPCQKYGDFKNNRISDIFINEAFKGNIKSCKLNTIYSKEINDSIIEGMEYFGGKIKKFNDDDTILAAPETRTSSPIRIKRDDNLMSNIKGIYPCGEGSGYAGGITTSAIDGIKVFESIYKEYQIF